MSIIKSEINSELNSITANEAILENVLVSTKYEKPKRLPFKKRFIAIAAAVAVLVSFVGFRVYDVLINDYFGQTLSFRVPFEDVTIYSAELTDDGIRISQSYIYTSMSVHHKFDIDSKTAELHFCFHGEEEKGGVRNDLIFQAQIHSAPGDIKTHDEFIKADGLYEIVTIYYCEGHALTGDMGGLYIGEAEKYLVWER
ncbi:MAG: hypothetical protein FWD48_07395 [Oscillospiraceae bacterium]|nr:hypothetical protein [Oscillospiraceae bacterium]